MKQFILIAYDAKDEGAYERRMKCRDEHLAAIQKLRASGNMIFGAAIMDDHDKMIGSVISATFPSRAEFNTWLKSDPYTVNRVWDDITVLNSKLAPAFADLLRKAS